MQRKPGPDGEGALYERPPRETTPRSQALVGTHHEYEQQLEGARREQANLIRRFVHEHAGRLRLLAVRLVGREAAPSVAQDAIVDLARRLRARSPPEAIALLKRPRDLWRLTCKITVCRAYFYLRRRRADPGFDVDRLERALHELSDVERIVHVLHHYYGFTEGELEDMFGLSKRNSRVLIHRANRALKHAMGVK